MKFLKETVYWNMCLLNCLIQDRLSRAHVAVIRVYVEEVLEEMVWKSQWKDLISYRVELYKRKLHTRVNNLKTTVPKQIRRSII